MNPQNTNHNGFDRRGFLKVTGAAASGLVLGFYVPERFGPVTVRAAGPFTPNAFLRIAPDDTITVLVGKSEMGQGVYTSLPMIVAEELDCDWSRVKVESAPAAPEYYDPGMGEQTTGGSTSVTNSWEPLRKAGASARAVLLDAAAKTWGVAPSSLRTEKGRVHHDASGRSASYGELSVKAASLPVPADVPLKDAKDFKIIGTNVKRLEGRDKVTGKAEFSIDVRLPGMLTAVVAHPPVCGGKVQSFEASKAMAVPGVVKVKPISTGIAVIAKDFWSARNAREALQVVWDDGPNGKLDSAEMSVQYRKLSNEPGLVAENEGDAEKALSGAAKTIEAMYEVPYLAHAPMEPLNAVAHVQADRCDIWAGTKYQTMDQKVGAAITGLKPEQIFVHTTLLGGGFGRRANVTSDFVADAVEVAKGENVPVKTVWTREEDIQCGYFRPMFVHKLKAGVDAKGMPVAWHQRLVGQSLAQGTFLEPFMMKEGIDGSSVEGAAGMPYAIPNRRIESHNAPRAMSVLWWRSVGHTHTGFVNESFLDEVAHAGGKDAYELRRELLKAGAAKDPKGAEARLLAVLEFAAEKAGWGKPLEKGRARGIAMRKSFDSHVAEVVEVSLDEKGEPRVDRVVCAVDCGITVNPWGVVAQVESAIVYGLTAALYSEVTLKKGRVQQSNFHNYPVLRMDRMPKIEVHLVKSTEKPTGVGEPGVPPLAAAVANALFALTGKRVRKLPIRMSEAV
jgi:isoquinoline 1-oxidoreductase beta subunit